MQAPEPIRGDNGRPLPNTSISYGTTARGEWLTCWFSYSTMIAFQAGHNRRVVITNYWSSTTGKHLTAIDGGDKAAKKARVTEDVFKGLYEEQVTQSIQIVQEQPRGGARNLAL